MSVPAGLVTPTDITLRLACSICGRVENCQLHRAALQRVTLADVPPMIELLVRCAAYVPQSLTGVPLDARPTVRELEVLRAVVEHGSIPGGAQALGIARATARNTLSKLYKRLGVRDRSQAVAWADDHVPEWRA